MTKSLSQIAAECADQIVVQYPVGVARSFLTPLIESALREAVGQVEPYMDHKEACGFRKYKSLSECDCGLDQLRKEIKGE